MMNHPHRFSTRENSLRVASGLIVCCVLVGAAQATEPFFEKSVLFEEQTDGFLLYRIPGIVVTAKGTVLAYCEARKFSIADRGEIEDAEQ
jgi:sialidase-1